MDTETNRHKEINTTTEMDFDGEKESVGSGFGLFQYKQEFLVTNYR